jgi:hypothetical protein
MLRESNATHYRLGTSRFSAADPWVPIAPTAAFTFPASPPGTRLRLFGQFRNAAGTTSLIVSDDITYTPATDTDGDGTPDVTDTDDDGDGVSDFDEINVLHTDSKKKDTDGDGYTDGEERSAGTNPLDASSVPDGDGDGFSNKLEGIYGSSATSASRTPNFGVSAGRTSGAKIRLTLPTRPGVIYQLRCTTNPAISRLSWPKIGGPITGTGANVLIDLNPSAPRQIYRFDVFLPPIP